MLRKAPLSPNADQVRSVSDALSNGETQRVGGRLLLDDRASDASPRLADAHLSLPIDFATATAPPHGALLVVEARLVAGRLVDARVVSCHEDSTPQRPDWRRLGLAGANPLLARAAILRTVRAFFHAADYLEVETPARVPSPGLDVHLEGMTVSSDDAPRFLSTSPEYQMKRLLSAGMPRIFQLARCFRGAECGRRHNPEFSMLEWYTAYASVEQIMDQTEALVRRVMQRHHTAAGSPLANGCDVAQPFARLTVEQAFERYAGVAPAETLRLAAEEEERFFLLLIDHVEPALAALGVAVFLHDYPACHASLARLRPDRSEVAERFELYVGDWELCNGFGELVDATEQLRRLQADQRTRATLDKPVYPIDERFLDALRVGMPAAAGNALGIDRLVALCLDVDDIDQVMAFSERQL